MAADEDISRILYAVQFVLILLLKSVLTGDIPAERRSKLQQLLEASAGAGAAGQRPPAGLTVDRVERQLRELPLKQP